MTDTRAGEVRRIDHPAAVHDNIVVRVQRA
jgi:hypothetical protein